MTAHAGLPSRLPRWGIFRQQKASDPSDPLFYNPTALLSTGNGMAIDTSASQATYESAGTSGRRSLVFTPNQYAIIDLANYAYVAIVFDEGGTNAVIDNQYFSFDLVFSSAR